MRLKIACLAVLVFASTLQAEEKISAAYTSIIQFATAPVRQQVVDAQPPIVNPKQAQNIAGQNCDSSLQTAQNAKFNTLFMTIYPLWGKAWWDRPESKELVRDALVQTKGKFHVHLGLSLFNAEFCLNPQRYPGALQTKQCDGTRPDWVCNFDDSLWALYIRNCVEMARLGKEVGNLDGVFLDPEGYGSECYFCFCNNCVRKFNSYAHEQMPMDLVKPDGWLGERGLMAKYMEWHDYEVRRHAEMLRDAVHEVTPNLQLSSLLWDLPIAVGVDDAREHFYRNLAIGLGTKDKPAWVLPEHTYYSDAPDLKRIISVMNQEIASLGAGDRLKVLPGIRLIRQSAASLASRAEVIKTADVPGYWMYELADVMGKAPIDFEGALVDKPQDYIDALGKMNQKLR